MTDATVVIPTHDHGEMLRPAVRSVLAQTFADFELFIVGDGVPDAARVICEEIAAWDDRIRFFDRPKGERHGERHRHEALAAARGHIVCYLSDDDLWLPCHLETMVEVLRRNDFAHTLPVSVLPGGAIDVFHMDLSHDWYMPRSFDDRGIRKAYVPLTFAGHTLDVYRRLPVGWTPTPKPLSTDRYMWNKILTLTGVRAASSSVPTAVHFASTGRRGWTAAERMSELGVWEQRLATATGRRAHVLDVLDAVVRDRARLDARLSRRISELVMRQARTRRPWRRLRDR